MHLLPPASAFHLLSTRIHGFLTAHERNPLPLAQTSRTHTYPLHNPRFIRCGPRDNRGPLVKGRVLSIEAIQAVQTLKRAQRSNPAQFPALVSKTLSRLIKADLVAALRELLRQDQCHLALQVFSAVRSEYPPDLSVYAEMALALARNEMGEDMDRLICDLETESGVQWESDKGLIRLIRAVIGADRRESTVRIYEMLKRNGWGSIGFKADEYMVRVLSKGLRRLGEAGLADEVDLKFGSRLKGSLENSSV
ncbi:protein THYLAKOID ASSEMBLY 8, chloroplastic-like [Pyrus x bretschneideri]|uniref:protein THYLAKOID ASSEMBLY 8, chloroplastic-like n=1 Tax=Pyrus x bretschneideri TaxID=225117 RepID=UPI002030C1EA|nr:protein THYLAKOID ASSEMBLY 8, chloroplastic-like [Pyrus x bretschneideri]